MRQRPVSGEIGSARRRPRIGVDGHSISGIHQGIRSHVLELFRRAPAAAPDLEFVMFVPDPIRVLAEHPDFGAENVTLVRLGHSAPAKRLLYDLPKLQWQHRLDLLHTQYIAPPLSPCRTVVTIHDILFETHPQYFSPFFVLRSRMMMRLAARNSALVCTVSEHSKGELRRIYGVPEERLVVIPNAADGNRFAPGDEGMDMVSSRGLTPGRYYLNVGRLEPRKNQANLIRAHALLPAGAPPLVIVGQKHFGYAEVGDLVARSPAGRVILLQDVGDSELPALYRHALLFAYPSWAEGYGMPIVEAFASGVPVIGSNTTALREVIGEAGRLVSPDDIGALARAMKDVTENEGTRAAMRQAGLRRAAEYRWDKSADTLVARYRDVLSC
jgi:glycosyltransferase involved in cell wall biosynthesis